jgi:hypothetical protein
MRWNTAPLLSRVRAHTIRGRVPRSWIYSMVVLVLCLLASMVIALTKLL